MGKKITAFALLLAFMASTFCQAVIVASYYADTAAYARSCENKARPMMHCNGKCQMMKKLQQQEKDEQQNPESKAALKNEIISSKSFYPQLASINSTIVVKKFFPYTESCPPVSLAAIFHPPQV